MNIIPIDESREAFEKWWEEEMNVEEMPLDRWDVPMADYKSYSCGDTARAWLAWQAGLKFKGGTVEN